MFRMQSVKGITEMKIKPTIVIDTREQTPLHFEHYQTETATLTTGDYSIKGMESAFSIERKSEADLIGSLTHGRKRFIRELERLRGYSFKRLLIEGSLDQIKAGNYRSKATPAAITGSLSAMEVRYDIPVVWAKTRTDAATLIESWCYYFLRERIKESEQLMQLIKEEPQTSHNTREGITA